MLFVLWIINFVISWVNAWGAGKGWVEAKQAGGLPRLLLWSAVVMSACGFTWCIMIVLGLITPPIAAAFGLVIPPAYTQWMFELGYLVIIVPIIGSGLVITVDSWAVFYRNRTLGNGAVAAWNTFAQISNMVDAARFAPSFLSDVLSGPSSSSSDNDDLKGKLVVLMVMIVGVSVISGCLLTRMILLRSAADHGRNVMFKHELEEASHA